MTVQDGRDGAVVGRSPAPANVAAMAATTQEALARRQDAEAVDRTLVEPVFDGDLTITTERAVEIEHARVKADRLLDTYLKHALEQALEH